VYRMGIITGAGRATQVDFEADSWAAFDQLQFARGVQLQSALLLELRIGRQLAERAGILAGLPDKLAQRRLDQPVPVTTASLLKCLADGGDPAALDALFAADGPNLGTNLEHADRLLQDLGMLGQSGQAPA